MCTYRNHSLRVVKTQQLIFRCLDTNKNTDVMILCPLYLNPHSGPLKGGPYQTIDSSPLLGLVPTLAKIQACYLHDIC